MKLARKPGSIALVILAMFAGSACMAVAQQAASSSAIDAEQTAIRKVLVDQVARWNNGEIPGFMKGYWKSEKTEFVNASGIFRGWDNVLQRYLREYPDPVQMGQLTFSDLEINTLSPDSAYVLGRWRLDRQSGPIGGIYTLILHKFPEGWKIIHDHTSQSPSAPAEKKP
ncbi:MAG TPA: nuclear transport factor 2 family protein [Candidatus Acidoferrales bacterium]|nr:nuclear transport factor 2 family protein [Candidatus Acidoferrales bacterium]